MINTKFVFGVSLVAIMAVGVAHADIAATSYFKGSGPIKVNNGTISVTVDSSLSSTSTNPVQNKAIHTALSGKEATANKLTSTATTTVSDTNKDTLYPSVGRVQSMINALDVSDSAQSGKYVSAVSETNGKIAVTRESLPTVNNATLTIQKNGTSVGTFTANASENKTINIEVPTKVSELTNDSSFATTTALAAKEATANKLTSTATTAVSDTNKDTLYPSVGRVQSMINALDVSDSAQSGKYVSAVSETNGKITVTRASLPTVNNATLTIQKNGTSVGTFTANASANKAINITVPTGGLASKDTISNTDVATNAAIAQSKIANLTTDLAAKEAIANKLTSTATTTVSDSNKDILYPSYAKVINMIGEQVDGRLGALSEGNTNLNTRLNDLNTDITVLKEDKVNIDQGVNNKAVITNSDGKITTGTIGTGMIANAAVTSVKIADGTVALADLASNSVNSAKIVDASVEAADLASNSVTTAKIADSAVTAAKTSGVIGQIPSGSATSATYASIWVE